MYGYYSSMILLIPAILLSIYAQSKVQGAYRTYLNVRNARGITGAEAASRILQFNDLQIPINEIEGTLTDNYNPQQGTMNLSAQVYELPTIASMAIAAHECGHALQHASGYSLLNFRNSIVPVANIGSMLSWPLLLVGLMMGQSGGFLFNLGIFMFLGVVLFHLVTLPVELDASKRALIQLEALNCFASDEEHAAAKQVLDAAALTYLAALATAVANLLRMLALRGNRR
ncbi:MAG: zinc metallopeptidase [Firmicutes bacterium]|nr:zinc metallopeptidase [Bacillota bacterium]MBR5981051.1 zinc metallopeptidase [Bacillota bacterium]